MDKIKILIVDDHPMMREALKTALAEEADMEVVGEASEGSQALALLEQVVPDVILMDLLMPEMDGLKAIAKIFTATPGARILVVSSLEDQDKVLAAVRAGALGYFPKSASRTILLEAIRKVADGIPYLPSDIALKLFDGLRAMTDAPSVRAVQELITSRQKEVLDLMGEGHSDAEIGTLLHMEEATVRSHIHNILQRLGLESRAQAAAYANQQRERE